MKTQLKCCISLGSILFVKVKYRQTKEYNIFWKLPDTLSDFFTNLFLRVPGLTRPKFFASQTRSSASHMGPTLNHKFYVSIQIRPIHRSQFEKQDTVILTYTIKSKLIVSCKIIFRAQAFSLCSSNSACLQVYCWKLLSPWTYGDDTILIFVNTICSQYSPRTSWACSNTLTILFAELILGFV